MNPMLPDDPNSKLNACVNNVFRIWEDGKDDKLTQLLFCDLSTPKNDGTFNVYDDIKATEPMQIGEYRGFKMELTYDSFHQKFSMILKGSMSHKVTLGSDARGNLIRLDNALANIPNRLEDVKTKLENLENQQKAAEAEIGKPFPQEKELTVKSARLAELDAELNMDERKSPKAKEERPSVLADLKQRAGQIPPDRHRSSEHEEVL